jgi:hypothetical protein
MRTPYESDRMHDQSYINVLFIMENAINSLKREIYIRKVKKRKFVFLGRQTINGNPHLLFQQICPPQGATTTASDVGGQGLLE